MTRESVTTCNVCTELQTLTSNFVQTANVHFYVLFAHKNFTQYNTVKCIWLQSFDILVYIWIYLFFVEN